ncbi:MAG: hypothetical protein WCV55_01105 [Candidatus Paceibacterota bacterium]
MQTTFIKDKFSLMKKIMKKNLSKLLFSGISTSIIFVVIFVIFFQINTVKGVGTAKSLTGYAWSDTIGWIAMSPDDSYGVKLNNDDTVTGYAWSENIGWIKFGGLAGTANNSLVLGGGDIGANWIERTSLGNKYWRSITSSSDGIKLAAVVEGGQIYTSIDSGMTWTPRDSNRRWYSITSSSDGIKLAAVVYSGQIYTSIDSGVTWTAQNSTIRKWSYITSNSDGTKLFALEQLNGEGSPYGQIYRSTDSGITWNAITVGNAYWSSIASSADGMKLVATVYYGGRIYTSTDGGNNWTPRDSGRYWGGSVSSPDGTKLAAVVAGAYDSSGYIYISTDSGVTWTPHMTDSSRNWSSVTMSSDGTKLAAVAYYYGGSENIYTSSDSGATWTARTTPSNTGWNYWQSIVSSSDGKKLAVAKYGGQMYTSTPSDLTVTDANLTGENLTGWARACAGTIGGDCNSATRTDGWDGWISLSGSSPTYGVKLSNSQGSHNYAWGSDVVGWINFGNVSIVNPCTPTYTCTPDNTGQIDSCTGLTATCSTGQMCAPSSGICTYLVSSGVVVDFLVSPNTINKNGRCNLSWNLSRIDASSTCALYQGSTLISSFPPSSVNGIYSDLNIQNETTYKLTCGEMATNDPAILTSSSSKYTTCNINPSSKEVN